MIRVKERKLFMINFFDLSRLKISLFNFLISNNDKYSRINCINILNSLIITEENIQLIKGNHLEVIVYLISSNNLEE